MNPNVYCVQGACAETNGTMSLNVGVGDNTMLSSLVQEDNEYMVSTRSGRTVEVTVYRLRDLLREREWPEDYGVLLVDTEGYDAQVLSEAGLDRWRPRVIITEEYLFNLDSLRSKHELLWRAGYAPFKRTGDNMIWIRQADWDETLRGYVHRRREA
jgi:FkbM family methyltransferase